MALIQFGRREIEDLRNELDESRALCEKLNILVEEKNQEIIEYRNIVMKIKEQLRDIEKITEENKMLNTIIGHVSKYSKATVENINRIRTLKEEGKSYRAIAKELSEVTGDKYAHSTVRYLYNKYIK